MNNRITELINKVGTDISGKWIRVESAQQLVYLTAQECATVCEKVGILEMEESDGKMYADAVKEHFWSQT